MREKIHAIRSATASHAKDLIQSLHLAHIIGTPIGVDHASRRNVREVTRRTHLTRQSYFDLLRSGQGGQVSREMIASAWRRIGQRPASGKQR